jgi:multiple sugar transport system permease protein
LNAERTTKKPTLIGRENRAWKLMMAPSILVLALISIYPSIFNIYNSLFAWNFAKGRPRKFVGLNNFISTLTDQNFLVALLNTLILVAAAVTVEFLLGFTIALLVNRSERGARGFRALMITPTMITPIVASLMWLLMYNSDYGIIKHLLQSIGVANPPAILASKALAMPAVILVDVWQWTPFVMLVLYAGLTAIPKELNEASLADGANAWQKFIHITLPCMKPVIAVVLLMRIMDTFKFFEAVYMLTKGGPGNSTETMSFFAYKVGFSFFEIGESSAICIIILVITTLICQALNKLIADEWSV